MSIVSELKGSRGGDIAGLFVKRPVLAIVLNLLIVVAGIAAFTGVEIRELPNVDQPVITIRTTYTGRRPRRSTRRSPRRSRAPWRARRASSRSRRRAAPAAAR